MHKTWLDDWGKKEEGVKEERGGGRKKGNPPQYSRACLGVGRMRRVSFGRRRKEEGGSSLFPMKRRKGGLRGKESCRILSQYKGGGG